MSRRLPYRNIRVHREEDAHERRIVGADRARGARLARRQQGDGRRRAWPGRVLGSPGDRLQVRPQADRARPPQRRGIGRLLVSQRGQGRADPVGAGNPPPRLPGQQDGRELPGTKPGGRACGRGTLPHQLRKGGRARRATSRPRKPNRNPKGNNVMTENVAKTALITGASRGLGLALASRLAREGWTLIIDARGKDGLETARAELSEHTRVLAIPGDVTDPGHRRALAEAVREAGGLDALVNNASILGPSPQPGLLDYPLNELEEIYMTNVISPLALVQAVRDGLKPGARIVNVTSDAALEPYEGWGG